MVDLRGEREHGGAAPGEAPLRSRSRWPFWPVVLVVVVGFAVTAALAWVSAHDYATNEQRLIQLRARDVAAALTSALPSIQTPLASAAALADATDGNRAKFERFIAPYVGVGNGRPFASVSLWRISDLDGGPVAVAGTTPVLARAPASAVAFLRHADASSSLSVIGLLSGPSPRLGYAYPGTPMGRFVAYAEGLIPPGRYAPPRRGAAFADLSYALYLGARPSRADLLIASVRRLPLPGRRATVRVPFGDTRLTVTVSARHSLAGTLPERLPWIIAAAGVLLTLGAAILAVRLIERRRASERLALQLEAAARETRRLYAEQRTIAQTLQHALLPASLPQPPGLQIAARYAAGAEGVDIGGDWYDVIELDGRRLLLVVGDVSGKGLPAATTMATLRFAIRAYVAEGDEPAAFLPKLSRLINVHEDRHLATVLCAVVDTAGHRVSITNAGHLPPLLLDNGRSRYLEAPVGLPVGIERDVSYASTTATIPAGGTLLAFTDGLVERRGESIEVGLERLRAQVSANHLPLERLLTRIVDELRQDTPDDTAVAGIRWLS